MMKNRAPIAVVDYGMGNLRSVQKGFERVGVAARVTRDPAAIEAAGGVVLPGVGAFKACMENLRRYGLVEIIRAVIAKGTPFLGICLGMQLLFEESDEFGPIRGLGVFPGRAVRFAEATGLRIPHMGWNRIWKRDEPPPHLQGIPDGVYVYFVHSYYVVTGDPSLTATTTPYGVEFTSSIARGNVFATQFHPEKSQAVGLKILENFGRLVANGTDSAEPERGEAG